jgi:hypothetical protein
MRDSLSQFIPEMYLYLTKLENEKISYRGQRLKSAYLINIINDLMIKYYFHKNDCLEKETSFNLWSIVLKDKYGMYYNYYINYLLEHDFITLKSEYLSGDKARTYTINHLNILNVHRVNITDKVMLKKTSPEYIKKSNLQYTNSPISENIRNKLIDDLFKIKVDTNASLEYLKYLLESKNIDHKKYQKNYISIENIADNNIFFKFDEYGRIHTNFTILKKEIRKNFITINNEPVIEIDITNSQPLFLSILIKNEMSKAVICNRDVSDFIHAVNNGLIYEVIMKKCNFEDRSEAKILMYRVLFGYNSDYNNENKIFKKLFPTVFNFIKKYKSNLNNYKVLSYKLQQMESEFIFGKVINEIMNTHPEITLFTVHDSICCQLRYKQIVESIFNYHMNNLLNR